jgi:hypothetical protein
VYFDVFGQPIITLNSLQAIEDLVVKKSAIFSGRPHLTMCQDLSVCGFVLRLARSSCHRCYRVGWEQAFAVLPPTQQWQVSRKLSHHFIGLHVMSRHYSFIESQGRTFVNGLLNESKGFREHFKL